MNLVVGLTCLLIAWFLFGYMSYIIADEAWKMEFGELDTKLPRQMIFLSVFYGPVGLIINLLDYRQVKKQYLAGETFGQRMKSLEQAMMRIPEEES